MPQATMSQTTSHQATKPLSHKPPCHKAPIHKHTIGEDGLAVGSSLAEDHCENDVLEGREEENTGHLVALVLVLRIVHEWNKPEFIFSIFIQGKLQGQEQRPRVNKNTMQFK